MQALPDRAPSFRGRAAAPLPTQSLSTTPREIACIFPDIKDSFALSIINGIQSVFPADRYIFHIFQSQTRSSEDTLLRYCLEGNIAGLTLFPMEQSSLSDTLLAMQRRNYPLVLIDRNIPLLDNSSYVVSNHEAAGALCLRYLYQLGHRRIAFITIMNRETGSIRLRIDGIQKESRKLNMAVASVHVVENLHIIKNVSFYQKLFQKLVSQDRVTAFIASDSSCCLYLYRLLESLSLSIPNDVSLLSFDNPQTGPNNISYFTYINQSEYTMGKEAGNILLHKLEDRDLNCYRKMIAPQLEIHQSTAGFSW